MKIERIGHYTRGLSFDTPDSILNRDYPGLCLGSEFLEHTKLMINEMRTGVKTVLVSKIYLLEKLPCGRVVGDHVPGEEDSCGSHGEKEVLGPEADGTCQKPRCQNR